MKKYPVVDLTGDSYLNPVPAVFDNGLHIRNVSQITSIAVHHDAAPRPHEYDSVARYRSEAATHYTRLGPGLQYHYKIDNTGVIFKIRPHNTWLYVVGTQENVTCLAICLDGYLHNDNNNLGQDPTREQYEALAQLLEELCEQHPEFPATWPNVRPHQDYAPTACCGNRFAPFITAINSKADAYNIPSNAVYDWPELQPSSQPVPNPTPVPTPTPTPTPVPPIDTRPEWEKNFVALDTTANMWTEGTATVIDMTTGKTISTLADNVQVEIAGKTSYAGTEMLISKYWVSRNVHTKAIPCAQLKTTPDPVVIPPTPTSPPSQADQDHQLIIENNNLLKQILALLQGLITKIGSIFK